MHRWRTQPGRHLREGVNGLRALATYGSFNPCLLQFRRLELANNGVICFVASCIFLRGISLRRTPLREHLDSIQLSRVNCDCAGSCTLWAATEIPRTPGVLSDTALHRPPPLFQARPGSWCVACARLRTVRAILWHRERALSACAGPGPGPGGRVAEEPCQPECSSFELSHGD
jgi:hypothetical protein